MRLPKILVLTAAILIFVTQTAKAESDTHSFEGSCTVAGYADLKDPMTVVPTQSWFSYRGQGRCMGTLDGTVLPDRGVAVAMTSEGPRTVHSCVVGIDPGITWQLRFDLDAPQRDVSIHGYGDIVDVLRSQSSVFHGQRDGTAVAQNTIQGHSETLQRCFAEGVTAGSVGIQIDTVTPLVSDACRQGATGWAHPDATDRDGDGCDDATDDADDDNDGRADPADSCPFVSGGTTNGCPDVSRSLSLRYASTAHAFNGTLSSASAACRRNQPVIVRRRVRGPDPTIGQDTTDSAGLYVIPKIRRSGTYYASAAGKTRPAVGNCLAATSPALTLN